MISAFSIEPNKLLIHLQWYARLTILFHLHLLWGPENGKYHQHWQNDQIPHIHDRQEGKTEHLVKRIR